MELLTAVETVMTD